MSEFDDIRFALDDLGETEEAVGRKLIELDCKGWKEEGSACPVYHYLTLVKGLPRIERVVADEVWIGDEPFDQPGQEPTDRLPLPAPVHAFVRSFDEGQWPALERH